MKPDPQDTQWPDEHHQQFMLEFERMIDNLENHPRSLSGHRSTKPGDNIEPWKSR
ncbi:MAG: hypothetical protein R3C56_25200 [Pirellulaceae bacterium]